MITNTAAMDAPKLRLDTFSIQFWRCVYTTYMGLQRDRYVVFTAMCRCRKVYGCTRGGGTLFGISHIPAFRRVLTYAMLRNAAVGFASQQAQRLVCEAALIRRRTPLVPFRRPKYGVWTDELWARTGPVLARRGVWTDCSVGLQVRVLAIHHQIASNLQPHPAPNIRCDYDPELGTQVWGLD